MQRLLTLPLLAALPLLLAGCDPASPAATTAPAPVRMTEYTGPDDEAALLAFARQHAPSPRQAVLYFGADWCGPCRRFRAALDDERVAVALQPAVLVRLDADHYPELAGHYAVTAIPAFLKVDSTGHVWAHITSDQWGRDTPACIAPVLRQLVSSHDYDEY